MILSTALLAGGLVGFLSAHWQKRHWSIPPLQVPWLVILAFLPQFLAIYLTPTRAHTPDKLAAIGVIVSQVLLLVFCWLNRRLAGVWLLALGLAFNLLVIASNGGFMPISPETASRLISPESLQTLQPGSRFGWKDILLFQENTRLIFLSDRLLPPKGFPYQIAFSIGDVVIGAGAFWLMMTQGTPLLHLLKSPRGKR